MVQLCIVQKYSIEAYPGEYDEYFMFYDTISDHPIFFNGEFLFRSKIEFLFWAEGNDTELERYTGKIPEKFL
jgi:hypothetical protein